VSRDAGPEEIEEARAALESALRDLNREARRRLRWGEAAGLDGEVIRMGGWKGAVARYLFRGRERWETFPLTLFLLPFERLHRGVRVLLARSSTARAPRRLPVPVVSVGNVSVGGTGKTPMVAWLARRLSGRGYRVAILTRGYGGERGAAVERVDGASPGAVGDEALLLARALPECVVYRGRDRYLAGLAAVARDGCDVCILDDGFQHRRLHRDIDIVLLHAERPFGTGWLLPAGPLREGPEALRRADLIVLCRRWGGEGDGAAAGWLPRGVARMRATLAVGRLRTLGGAAREIPPEEIRGKRLLAFAGVGDPRSFLEVVERYEPEAVRFLVFPDHHPYPAGSIDRIRRESERWGAEGLITTEKDAVKLDADAFDGRPCYVPGVDFAPERGEAALEELLALLDVRRNGADGTAEGGACP
jgi:tetraacyldisaccharide 4'-kinase